MNKKTIKAGSTLLLGCLVFCFIKVLSIQFHTLNSGTVNECAMSVERKTRVWDSERANERARKTNKNLCRNISTSLSFHWFDSLVFSFPPIQGFFHDILNGIARLFVDGAFGAFFVAVYYVLKQALAQTRNDYSMSKARLIFLSLSLSSNVVGPHFVVFSIRMFGRFR